MDSHRRLDGLSSPVPDWSLPSNLLPEAVEKSPLRARAETDLDHHLGSERVMRVDNGRARWLCVELPEIAAVRRLLLPAGERQCTLAQSALDLSWRDEVDDSRGVLITAQGLLMYLRPPEVRELIAGCAERFRGGALVFDAVPRWFSARTMRGEMRTTQDYRTPPMPWGLDAGEL
jgi:O-methyltransferase involved in polyketide biosynthesis